MNFAIPYTFYPSALPDWISWMLFGSVIAGSVFGSWILSRFRSPTYGILALLPLILVLLLLSTLLSAVIMFFIHGV